MIVDVLEGQLPLDITDLEPYTNNTSLKEEKKIATEAPEKAKNPLSSFRPTNVDPRTIVVEQGYNARDFDNKVNKEHVKALAASIKEVGVLNPITVRYDKKTGEIILVDGESRLRATLLAIEQGHEIQTIPVTVERANTSAEDRLATQITRNEGKKFEILEQAAVFQRLKDFGWNDTAIAAKTGKTGPFIGSVLKLNAAPEKLKKLIRDGSVSASLAIDVLRSEEFDYEKAYGKLSDGVATAAATGATKATAKHVTKKTKEATGTPLHFQRGIVGVFIDALAEIATDTSLPRGVRSKAKGALENGGIDAKEWLADGTEDDE